MLYIGSWSPHGLFDSRNHLSPLSRGVTFEYVRIILPSDKTSTCLKLLIRYVWEPQEYKRNNRITTRRERRLQRKTENLETERFLSYLEKGWIWKRNMASLFWTRLVGKKRDLINLFDL